MHLQDIQPHETARFSATRLLNITVAAVAVVVAVGTVIIQTATNMFAVSPHEGERGDERRAASL